MRRGSRDRVGICLVRYGPTAGPGCPGRAEGRRRLRPARSRATRAERLAYMLRRRGRPPSSLTRGGRWSRTRRGSGMVATCRDEDGVARLTERRRSRAAARRRRTSPTSSTPRAPPGGPRACELTHGGLLQPGAALARGATPSGRTRSRDPVAGLGFDRSVWELCAALAGGREPPLRRARSATDPRACGACVGEAGRST